MVGIIKAEAKIGPKGQIVIPKALRQATGVSPGSTVIVALEGNKITVEKSKTNLLGIIEKYGEHRKRFRLPKDWRHAETKAEEKELELR